MSRPQGIWNPEDKRRPRGARIRRPSAWVRLSAGIADHSDIIGLPSNDARWAYIVLLSKAKLQPEPGTFRTEGQVGHILGRGLRQCLPALIAAGLITTTQGGGLALANWQRWQTPAGVDRTAADRQRRHRERERGLSHAVTNAVTGPDHVTVTNGGPPLQGYMSRVTPPPEEVAVTATREIEKRRDLAAIIRNAPNDAMRHRYRRIFDKTYGHLYERSVA